MPLSLIQRAKRAFVSVLLKLAFDYGVAVDINRESDDKAVLQCYRRVVKKVHPDKGGNKKKFQTLQVYICIYVNIHTYVHMYMTRGPRK